MKKRLAIAFVFAVVLAAITAPLVRFSNREPHYEGRPLHAWVHDLRHGNNEEKLRAAELLRAKGSEAAPYLAANLAKKPGLAQRFKSSVSPYIPDTIKRATRRFFDPTKQVMDQYSTAEALRLIGTNGLTAVPALGQLLTNGNILLSITASRALAQMGSEAVGPLTSALDSPDYNIRAAACDGLANLGPAAAPAAPRLARILRSEVGAITSSAAYSLSRIGESSVPVLVPLLTDTNWYVRSQAAYSLGHAGVAAKGAEGALLDLAKDEHPQVRAAAVDALSRINPFSKESLDAALAALEDRDPVTRAAGLQLLRNRPHWIRQDPERIIALLDDESPEVRGYAALAISVAPAAAQRAIPRLEELAAETNKVLQASAREALQIIRELPPE